MKKCKWGLAALTLAAMAMATSCDKGTVVNNDENGQRLGFGVLTGKQTISRVAETTTASIATKANSEANAIEVSAHYNSTEGYATVGNNFANPKVWHSGGTWQHNGPVYHPQADLIHWAVYPTIAKTVAADAQSMKFDYTIGDPASQVDLMAAVATSENSLNGAQANLPFKHVLSQINFAIQGKDGLRINVNNIQLNGIKNNGTYTMQANNAGSWVLNDAATANYAYPSDNAAITTGQDNEIKYLTSDGLAPASTNSYGLMLMPQKFEVGGGASLTFNYVVSDALRNYVIKSEEGKTLKIENFTWVEGKRYLYVINVSDPNKLSYSVEVSGWEDAANSPVTVK